ncbi:MAG TPA: FtsQ-type POTRA domain-containing protein [Bryocella sp.]|nr:FtsQ-type POTRA domain-containing protein [Bryocella sp.]
MARKNASAISDDELEERIRESAARTTLLDESPLDARLLELDDEAESPFLRGQRRVPVRRRPLPLPRGTSGRLKLVLVVGVIAVGATTMWIALHRYGTGSWRFRLDSSDNISIAGTKNVTRAQVRDVMAGDIERNIFFVPLEQRQQQLEQIPWVKSATVMRLLPNRLKIVISERTPAAFVDIDSHIQLIDGGGVVMPLEPVQNVKYSFPVIVGMSDSDPLSTRAARMKIYEQFIKELDSGGAHYSSDISDVDLSDPDDVKATVTDPQGAVLVHLGSSNFLERFKTYVAHVQEWRSQFPGLQSVSLRYDHQVIVNPDLAVARPAASESTAQQSAGAAANNKDSQKLEPPKKHKKHR